MSRENRLRLLLAVVALAVAGIIGLGRMQGHAQAPPVSTADLVFRSFDLPEPSPTPIPGLHEYAAPLRSAPTATPEPDRASRPKRGPAAGHTSSGSGARTIRTHHRISGKASWHATGRDGLYAAACRPLRRAMGADWRGQQVLVVWKQRAVAVRLNDWCRSADKTIDLSDEAFRWLSGGSLSRGVLRVTVEWP